MSDLTQKTIGSLASYFPIFLFSFGKIMERLMWHKSLKQLKIDKPLQMIIYRNALCQINFLSFSRDIKGLLIKETL